MMPQVCGSFKGILPDFVKAPNSSHNPQISFQFTVHIFEFWAASIFWGPYIKNRKFTSCEQMDYVVSRNVLP